MPSSKILIVEDELILADNIKISLEKHGYDVVSLAVSGEEALRAAEKEKPDLVLMDIVLKGDLDGINTADQIRKQFGIPVIFITAYSEEEIFQSAKITEPFAYITKPFDTRQLIINIEMALYKSELDKEKEKLIQDLNKEITERKQIEESLREKNELNFALFEHNPIETIAVDTEGRITNFNLAKKKSGDRLPAIGDVMYRDYAGRHEIDMYTELLECIRTGKSKEFPERKYGDRFISINIAPFPHGAVITSQDITNQKEAEEQLFVYQDRLRSLAVKLSKTEEHERRRIATYLHDQIGQVLVVARMKFGALKESDDKKEIDKLIDEIQTILEQTIKDTRSITFDLSPPILYELGFEPAIEWIGEKISEENNILIKFKSDKHPKPVEKDMGIFLYRSAKECLTNVVKHAQAHSIKVNIIKENDYIRVIIEDDGIGFDTSILELREHPVGFGLFSIRERIEYLGGNLLIESESGKGTKIIMSVPLKTS